MRMEVPDESDKLWGCTPTEQDLPGHFLSTESKAFVRSSMQMCRVWPLSQAPLQRRRKLNKASTVLPLGLTRIARQAGCLPATLKGVRSARCGVMQQRRVLLPCIAFMGALPRVTSRNGILTFTITDLHLLDAQCHTFCMAQCNDLLQPMSIISAVSMTATAPAASTAVTMAAMIQAVVTTSAAAQFSILV